MRKTSKPNIILIVLDSIRSDHLSCYGYRRNTSPNIDEIAKQGALFGNAFSTSSWTPPSHASIFTGKYPSYHKTLGEKNLHLARENTTLAEILTQNGYISMGVTACSLLSPEYGFDKGFQQYFTMYDLSIGQLIKQSPMDAIRMMIYGQDKFTCQNNKMIKRLLKKNRIRKRPFFLFVNYFNCHAPYDPPRPFKGRFCNGFHESRLYMMEFILSRITGRTTEKISNPNVDIQKIRHIANGRGGFSFMSGELKVSEREWEIVRSWYDGEIAYLDYCIGELVKFLLQEDILDDTFLIITSDHGESFGDHNFAGHAYCLYDHVIHVPLIMRYPPLIPEKSRISKLVSTIDILPTVLEILNLKKIHLNIQGVSLYPFEKRKFHDFICAEFGEGHTEGRARIKMKNGVKCVRSESYKYILSSDQREELYNVQEDPLEKINIVDKYPRKVRFLKEKMKKIINISYFGSEESCAKEERKNIAKRLETLGYT